MKHLIIAAAFALSSTVIFSSPAAAQEDAFARGVSADERGDYVEAAKWYRMVAEQGNAIAQHNLGVMYSKGEGVPENDAEGVKWYRRAAEQGYAYAQLALGTMYAKGEGVPEDYVQAYKWWNLSAAQGNENAIANKEMLRKRMTPEQIAEAQKLSAEWKPVSER